MTSLNRDIKKGILTYCIPILYHNNKLGFEMEYQQNPYVLEGKLFKWKDVHVYDSNSTDIIVHGVLKQYHVVKKIKMMDMAFGESKTADWNVLLVLGLYRQRLFIIDAWIGHWGTQERFKAIGEAESLRRAETPPSCAGGARIDQAAAQVT